MSTLKLISISDVKTEKVRIDNKVSRQYYTAKFQNPANPFAKAVSRTFWQQHNADGTKAVWNGADPTVTKSFINKEIPASIVSRTVEPYEIEGADGTPREATTYTAVVMDGETPEAVFKANGKTIVEAANVSA